MFTYIDEESSSVTVISVQVATWFAINCGNINTASMRAIVTSTMLMTQNWIWPFWLQIWTQDSKIHPKTPTSSSVGLNFGPIFWHTRRPNMGSWWHLGTHRQPMTLLFPNRPCRRLASQPEAVQARLNLRTGTRIECCEGGLFASSLVFFLELIGSQWL